MLLAQLNSSLLHLKALRALLDWSFQSCFSWKQSWNLQIEKCINLALDFLSWSNYGSVQSPEDGSPGSTTGPPNYGWSGIFSELNLTFFGKSISHKIFLSLNTNMTEIWFGDQCIVCHETIRSRKVLLVQGILVLVIYFVRSSCTILAFVHLNEPQFEQSWSFHGKSLISRKKILFLWHFIDP